CQKYSESPFTF
nr:immunoglobulin light chain junction region [Macaca mulatta]MOV61684.1 immunoglobulin light chain junction region [Macaca mulatta]MOV61780.1 immunoglobulin light chain junction region [Macaca mulatta]